MLRSHDFPTAKDFTGADLYLDDGRYYYGATLAELKAAANVTDLSEGVPKLERDAAKAASRSADQARRRMIDATWAEGEPTPDSGADSGREAARSEKLEHAGLPMPTPAPQASSTTTGSGSAAWTR